MLLYKYCTYSLNSLSIFINQKVWYSKPINFNDPFDGDIVVSPNCTFDEYIETFNHKISSQEHYDHAKHKFCDENGIIKPDIIEDLSSIVGVYKHIGVICLTKRKDSVLMWSHYADDHKGFAVRFDISDGIPVKKIKYRKDTPKRHITEIYKTEIKGDYVGFCFTKHKDWKYEKEYRISIQKGNRLLNSPGRITEVILGLRMTDSNKETMADLIRLVPGGDRISILEAYKLDDLSLGFKPYVGGRQDSKP